MRRLPLLAALALPLLSAQPAFDDAAAVSLRVQLGANDSEPAKWDGSLSVRGGSLIGLSSLRPRPDDAIDGASWTLNSWQGPNYRYPAPKPQTVTGVPVNIFSPGLIVDLEIQCSHPKAVHDSGRSLA